MAKRVICINKYIVIHEVFSARIVRRIYVNQIDFAFVCFFQKFEACQIIAFDKEVHLSTVVDEKPCIFRQYGKIIFKYFVNAFAVFFKNKTVFFAFNILFNIGNICKQLRCVIVLWRRLDKSFYIFNLFNK